MTYTDEIARAASHRFALIRMTGARYLTTDLASIGGGKYTYAFAGTIVPVAVTKNGSASGFTKMASAAAVTSAGHWHVDEDTGLVTLYPTGVFSAATDHYVITHYLFFSSGPEVTAAPETPTDSNTSMRQWEPRLRSSPQLTRDLTNALAGVFTISGTSIEVDNVDRSLNRWLSSDDSFNERDVAVYFCINDLEHIALTYTGRVVSVVLDSGSVAFTFTDGFSRLIQPAYMGDTYAECVYLRTSLPNLNPAHQFRPCRYIIGWSSRYDVRKTVSSVNNFVPTALGSAFGDFFEEACNTNYGTQGTTRNREWSLCRVPFGALRVINYGTGVRTKATASQQRTGHNLVLGHRFQYYDAAPNQATISRVAAFTLVGSPDFGAAGTDYNVAAIIDNDGYIYPSLPPNWVHTDATVIPANGAYDVHLYLSKGGTIYSLIQNIDFTVALTTTSGGNSLVKITLTDAFETSYALSALDPDADTIFFRVTTENGANSHADIVKALCEKSGMVVDAGSFATANTALAADCMFSIPQYDEQDYGRYLDYIQAVLDGTMGVVALKSSGTVTYNLLTAPAPSATRTANETLVGSVDVELDYQDIGTTISAFNPHNQAGIVLDDTSGPALTRSSDKARYLHNLSRTLQLRHVLEKIGNRIDAIMAVRAERRAVFTYRTATADLEVEVGDDIALTTDNMPGANTPANLKVLSFTRALDSVKIKATDLKGL